MKLEFDLNHWFANCYFFVWIIFAWTSMIVCMCVRLQHWTVCWILVCASGSWCARPLVFRAWVSYVGPSASSAVTLLFQLLEHTARIARPITTVQYKKNDDHNRNILTLWCYIDQLVYKANKQQVQVIQALISSYISILIPKNALTLLIEN